MQTRHSLRLLSIRLMLLAAGLCLPVHAVSTQVTLQLRWHHQAQFIGYYMAKKKGFYQQQGLNVSILPGGAGIIPWQQVTRGKADFAVDNTNALVAYMFGEPLIALAAIFQHSPSILIAKKTSQITTAQDTIGKRIMMFPGGQDPELTLMLHQAGVSLDQIQLIATSADVNDLLTDQVDLFNGYLSNEPYLLDRAGIAYDLLKPKDYGVDFYSDILLTNQQLITEHPDIAQRFVHASLAGWRYAFSHPEESITLLKETYQVDKTPGHLRYELNIAHELVMPELIEIGHMNMRRWQHIVAQMSKAGLLQPKHPIEDFIQAQTQPFDWTPWRPWLYMAATLLLFTSFISVYLYSLNRQLKQEINTRQAAENQLRFLADHDPLTQLNNRSALATQLDTLTRLAKRNQQTPAILFIDLDGFKAINDTYGHDSGDQVLVRFVQRVNSQLRNSDIFGRLGGDEFLILLDNTQRSGAATLANKVLAVLEQPFILKNGQPRMSASIGIALYTHTDESADQFLIRADKAMYHIKKSGKAGIGFAPAYQPKQPS